MSCSNPSGQKELRGRYSHNMRILITGGFGFVGGRVAVHLVQAGHTVVLGSRKLRSPPRWLPYSEVVQVNWIDSFALENICRGVDIVIHAAGMNAQDCAANPDEALFFNGVSTSRLVSAACKSNVQKFIFLSTAHVYCSPLEGIINEDTCPTNLHPYATSHLAGEQSVLWANECGLISGIVLRLSNIYGAPVHKDVNCWMLLVNDLCRQVVQSRKLILRSSGKQLRDFISITEVCRVLELLVLVNNGDRHIGIFNLGSSMAHSILSFSKIIQKRCLHIFSYEPVLELNILSDDFIPCSLNYQTNNLASLGIKVVNRVNLDQIDDLLLFCKKNFINL